MVCAFVFWGVDVFGVCLGVSVCLGFVWVCVVCVHVCAWGLFVGLFVCTFVVALVCLRVCVCVLPCVLACGCGG